MAQSEYADLTLQFSHERLQGLDKLKKSTHDAFEGPLRVERVVPSEVGNFGWRGVVSVDYDPIVGPIQEYLERRIDEEMSRPD